MSRKRLEWPLVHLDETAEVSCPHCGARGEDGVALNEGAITYRPRAEGLEHARAVQYGVGRCLRCGVDWRFRRVWPKGEEERRMAGAVGEA